MSDEPEPLSELSAREIKSPPTSVLGILSYLGPGLILAGSIVGSGELIATTKTGAEAGFTLLWLILLGCVIKIFVQIEFGRFTITEGRGTMEALDLVPGPRFRASWLVWCWLVMFSLSTAQLGGIVGVVGQSLAMPFPITGDFQKQVDIRDQGTQWDRQYRAAIKEAGLPAEASNDSTEQSVTRGQIKQQFGPRPQIPDDLRFTYDDVYWAALVTVVTVVMLVVGRYGLIQQVSIFLVAGFTAVTVFTVIALQWRPEWTITWDDLAQGLSLNLPPATSGKAPVATALAAFGIIGVGASELISYPYWCLEKGYAKFTGPRNETAAWAQRALGWMRVMLWDSLCCMVVYTFATVAFFLLGAVVLHRAGLNPSDAQLVPTLIEMYMPVFGKFALPLFVFGAFAVLYSTFFAASAGNARVASDALRVLKFAGGTEERYRWWIRFLSGLLPCISLTVYVVSGLDSTEKNPVTLVLISGLAQATLLPMLGFAALHFRYNRCDPRICPGPLWSLLLWASVLGLLVTGTWGIISNAMRLFG